MRQLASERVLFAPLKGVPPILNGTLSRPLSPHLSAPACAARGGGSAPPSISPCVAPFPLLNLALLAAADAAPLTRRPAGAHTRPLSSSPPQLILRPAALTPLSRVQASAPPPAAARSARAHLSGAAAAVGSKPSLSRNNSFFSWGPISRGAHTLGPSSRGAQPPAASWPRDFGGATLGLNTGRELPGAPWLRIWNGGAARLFVLGVCQPGLARPRALLLLWLHPAASERVYTTRGAHGAP